MATHPKERVNESFPDGISRLKTGEMIRKAIYALENQTTLVKVEKGGHTVDQVIQRLYGVKKTLDNTGLGVFTYGELKKAEGLSLSIAVLTVLAEARDVGFKV